MNQTQTAIILIGSSTALLLLLFLGYMLRRFMHDFQLYRRSIATQATIVEHSRLPAGSEDDAPRNAGDAAGFYLIEYSDRTGRRYSRYIPAGLFPSHRVGAVMTIKYLPDQPERLAPSFLSIYTSAFAVIVSVAMLYYIATMLLTSL